MILRMSPKARTFLSKIFDVISLDNRNNNIHMFNITTRGKGDMSTFVKIALL